MTAKAVRAVWVSRDIRYCVALLLDSFLHMTRVAFGSFRMVNEAWRVLVQSISGFKSLRADTFDMSITLRN